MVRMKPAWLRVSVILIASSLAPAHIVAQPSLWIPLVDALARKTLERPVLGISIALANH
jgi:hypothetical protein